MNFLNSDDPIIAVSTSNISNAAIGLIRLSGFPSLNSFGDILNISFQKIKPRYAHFTKILDHDGSVIDEIILTYFPAPHSYTGENILELSVHGNILNINRIIQRFIDDSICRMANPGEFTYRALRNKKLSLSQVEGLDLFINANSQYALSQGYSLMSGQLKEKFDQLYQSFLNHKSSVELSIDFAEDVGLDTAQRELLATFNTLKSLVTILYNRTSQNTVNLIKPDIVLIGRPNAGKSSLFNFLLNDERAIINRLPGTTRDFIREDLFTQNAAFNLIDTAGLRPSDDEVELAGIDKVQKLIDYSFLTFMLINPNENQQDFSLFNLKQVDLFIFTHTDHSNYDENKVKLLKLLSDKSDGPIEPKSTGPIEPKSTGPIEPKSTGPIEPQSNGPIEPQSNGPIEPRYYLEINTAERNSSELTPVLEFIDQRFEHLCSHEPILVNRHRESIKNIYNKFEFYESILMDSQDIAIIGSELNILGHCISELLGIVSTEDVLNNVFENFCIGK